MKQAIRIVFMGTPEFSVPVLEGLIENYEVVLVVTQPDAYVGRKKVLTFSPVKETALKHGIPVFQPIKIRKDYQPVLDAKPDMIITCAYGQIIGREILEYPKYKCINVHASLLPKYRGGAPIHKAVMNGDSETGITIMYMDEKMDTGDILSQKSMPILPTDTTGSCFEKLSLIGRDLLLDTMPSILNGNIVPTKQLDNLATYAYNVTREEEHIDFNKKSIEIVNQVRGLNPWPIAYFSLAQTTIKVYSCKKAEETVELSPSYAGIIGHHFYIGTQDGAVEILELQLEGKKKTTEKEFVNGSGKHLLNEFKRVE